MVLLADLDVLEAIDSVYVDLPAGVTGEDDRGLSGESHYCLGDALLGAISKGVEVCDLRVQVVLLQIPNFNATVVGDGGEDRGGVWTPLHVVYLLLVGHFMADELLIQLLGLPDTDSPIVGAGHENGAVNRVPEGVTSDLVDRACVTIVGLVVLL